MIIYNNKNTWFINNQWVTAKICIKFIPQKFRIYLEQV
jgi:hypothetical protein